MYIKRNESGQVIQASIEKTEECDEFVPPCTPDLQQFLEVNKDIENLAISRTDMAFVRVLEDVINVLMDKGVISFTDLPEPAQQKLLERQSLRQRIHQVGLISDSDDAGII